MRPCWIRPTCRARKSAARATGRYSAVPGVIGGRHRVAAVSRRTATAGGARCGRTARTPAGSAGRSLRPCPAYAASAAGSRNPRAARVARGRGSSGARSSIVSRTTPAITSKHDQRAVARAVGVDRCEEQPVAGRRASDRRADQHRVDVVEQRRSRATGKRPSTMQPAASHDERDPLEHARVSARTRGSPRAVARETRSRRTSP